jgi:glycosyltransferase involved in cell wall biosynthesis
MLDKTNEEKVCIVHVTTYPPRECGLASFSADLIAYFEELFQGKVDMKVLAMNTSASPKLTYPGEVILEIREDEAEDYVKAAAEINEMPRVKVVSIQHEFGIFGRNYGENIIHFLEKLEKPAAITFHTVLLDPAPKMKEVMENIVSRASQLVVMTELSKKILKDIYGAPDEKIKIIPHGIHPQLYMDTTAAKKKLKLEGRLTLSTFGLLNRGKGIEYVLQALPQVIASHPNALYLIIGATHPVVFRNEGEVYRNELIALTEKLGVQNNVLFINKYVSREDLLLYLEATDIYIASSQDPQQTVSGTLTYALGSGRPVISTAFMQAKELVTLSVGILVPFHSFKEIAEAIQSLLGDREKLTQMGKAAYFATRNMTWPNVALSYMSMYSTLFPNLSQRNKYMLPVKVDHLKKLTDDFGILQFAVLHNPDPAWGYTLDDNARALVAVCWYYKIAPNEDLEALCKIYLDFIERAAKDSGRFINYFDGERKPHEEFNNNKNLEDADARACWALAVASGSSLPPPLSESAKVLFEKQLVLHKEVKSPRAAAFYIKAFAEYSKYKLTDEIINSIQSYADFLVDLFQRSSDGEWQWFEESLTYSNGILPDALLVAYTVTENPLYFEIAQKSLDFLLAHSFEDEVCVPVGQAGWFKKGGKKHSYDQQPEEVSALVFALHEMILVSKDHKYQKMLVLAFDWFLGNNLSQQVVYTHSTGGSYDGIVEGGINLNQGAESTISYLLARLLLENRG